MKDMTGDGESDTVGRLEHRVGLARPAGPVKNDCHVEAFHCSLNHGFEVFIDGLVRVRVVKDPIEVVHAVMRVLLVTLAALESQGLILRVRRCQVEEVLVFILVNLWANPGEGPDLPFQSDELFLVTAVLGPQVTNLFR